MKLHSVEVQSLLFFVLLILPLITADLNSDKIALLNFAASVPQGRKLNWKNKTSVCTSWSGVSCNGRRVTTLRLPGIGLYGPIPPNTLGNLDALTILSLHSNFLNGSLPSDILSLPSLSDIYLNKNSFSGEIPSDLSSQLVTLDLSSNSFTGNIPDSIQNLTNLNTLNLQRNLLTGSVPDLQSSNLKNLNVSNNQLNGSIPTSLKKFPASAFGGNSGLCGSPLTQCVSPSPAPSPSPTPSPSPSPSPTPRASPSSSPPLPSPSTNVNIPPPRMRVPPAQRLPSQQKDNKKLSKGAVIAISVVSSSVLLLLLLTLLLFCAKKKEGVASGSKSKALGIGRIETPKEDFSSGVQEPAGRNKLVFFDRTSYKFDLEDLLRASAEVLGKGGYGTTYKAILGEGTMVVVKRLKEVVVGKRGFEQQMEIIGNVAKHPNVVPLLAYYYSKDEKLLIYDCATSGSLSSLLHGNRGSGRTLDWETRLKVALGTAKGIAHIHLANGGKLCHGNIKSANVLLDQDNQGHVTDFGLTPLMGIPTLPPRTSGYHAPEVIDSKKATQKSDIYSFGVLLLEMLTGKAPVQSSSAAGQDEVVDLPRWVQSVVREEWTAEVFDVDLIKYQNVEEEMVQMLQIAMTCVSKTPETRPKMDQVVRMIAEIRLLDHEYPQSSSQTP
uniref:probable inactive receptor kinase At5g58300 n=1 Tax=Erigeron canadensis TaxID=72917 RepID=UPI001CB9085D|nr:probable inactive receptor kinase At5g58300 [Erigeron canadensis]